MINDNKHCCLACQKIITYRFALCTMCEEKHGSSALQWPEWLRFLWNDTQRERRRDQRVKQFEVSFTDMSRSSIEQLGIDSGDDPTDDTYSHPGSPDLT